MQKKKNIRLLLSLCIMIVAIIGLFIFNQSKNNPSVDKAIFQITDLDKVDRVLLQSSKEKIELKYNGTKWLVNNTHEADRQMIKVLFAALKQVEAKRKVSSSLQDSLQKEISKTGIKISCFEGETLAKEFWSKGNEKSETYFQLSDGFPYLVTIPGYRVYVASVFEVPANDWRDRRVFNFNWQNIKSLEVNFPGDTKQSFKASFIGRVFGIESISTDTTKLDTFMDVLLQLRADRILTAEQAKVYDSLASLPPIETITIQDIASRTYELKIFPPQKGKTFVVAKKDDELIELSASAIREIFKGKSYFESSR